MSRAYFGYQLSDNIIQREDGSIVCMNCVLGRTGFQTYRVADLPQDRAAELGIDISNPDQKIKLYRDEKDVFHPDHLASIEAGPVTDNHPPGDEFVNPENFSDLAKGHVQNVRKGKEPLDDGNLPILGDIVIAAEPLLSDVLKKRKREISLGYDYRIDRDGDLILQVGMINNHTAIVPDGRAGDEARITDSAPPDIEVPVAETAPAAEAVVALETPALNVNNQPAAQEKKPMNWSLKSLFGMGLKEAAKQDNVDPEALADAAQQFSRITRGSVRANDAEEGEEHRGEDRRSDDRHADDRHRSDDRHADDRRTDDRRTDDRHADDRRSDDRRTEDFDEESDRLHKQLDRMIDARRKRSGDRRTEDTDMNELRSLVDEFLEEESGESEHGERRGEADATEGDPDLLPEGEEEGEVIEAATDELGEVAPEAHVVQARDVEGFEDENGFHPIRNSEGYKRGKAGDPRKRRAADAAQGAISVLNALKPMVARSRDSALRAGWNAQMRRAKGRSIDNNDGSYGRFAEVSRDHSRARDTGAGNRESASLQKTREFYAKAHKNNPAEVK